MQVWTAAALFACAAALWKPMARDRGRIRAAFAFLALWLSALAAHRWEPAREIAPAFLALAAVQVVASLAFDIVLRRVQLPKFVSEMLIGQLRIDSL